MVRPLRIEYSGDYHHIMNHGVAKLIFHITKIFRQIIKETNNMSNKEITLLAKRLMSFVKPVTCQTLRHIIDKRMTLKRPS